MKPFDSYDATDRYTDTHLGFKLITLLLFASGVNKTIDI